MALHTASVALLENGSATSAWMFYPGGLSILSILLTGGSVTLEQLGPDGNTAIAVTGAIAANSRSNQNLAPGQYRAVVAGGATAVWARLDRVP